MPPSSPPNQPTSNDPNLLGSFAGSIGILSLFLYFTGWIYRWAYFGFFQLELTSLEFPVESFFFVPLQVFLGAPFKLFLTLVMVSGTFVLIRLTFALFKIRPLRAIATRLPQPFFSELIVVFWLLFVLFGFAKNQGTIDARRDATQDTSLLPIVTLVTPKDTLALGRYLNNPLTDPSLQNYQIVGDKNLFDRLRGTELNDTTNTETSRTWHLLIANKGWLYLFPAIPANSPSDRRPPVLAIQEGDGGDRLMILSPEVAE